MPKLSSKPARKSSAQRNSPGANSGKSIRTSSLNQEGKTPHSRRAYAAPYHDNSHYYREAGVGNIEPEIDPQEAFAVALCEGI